MNTENANYCEDLSKLIYNVRGVKVMLDADLAAIYGYTTKAFNQQVKNNIEKFDYDFRFQLTKEEYENLLRSKKLTSNVGKKGGRQYLPFVFTEQGIYMLMTVLKGDLATEQSKVLIRSRRSSGLPSDRGRVVEQSGVVILKTSERPLNFFQENCKIL